MKYSKHAALTTAALIVGQTQTAVAAAPAMWGDPLVDGILSTVIYSVIGIVMAFLSFKVIDLITPGHLAKSIAENNIALAVLTGLMMLGICIIIAAVLAS
ncbi:MAG: DUF350 domain-containing protein [Bdellovibrionales bacterium]|nr:DUF350 domain-containing protein [Bdellovibrionales bacterium]